MSTEKRYAFTILGLSENTFSLVSFEGGGGISEIFQFEVTLSSKKNNLRSEDVIRKPCALHFKGFIDRDLAIKGIVFNFREIRKVGEYIIYVATIAPRLKLLGLTSACQIFLDKSIPEIIELIFMQFNISNYELRLQNTYPKLEYVCQFNESHLNFISRWMEKLGMYYFFISPEDTEIIVITDSLLSHEDVVTHELIYKQVSGLDHPILDKLVKVFTLDYNSIPDSIQIKDYNYSLNNIELRSKNDLQQEGNIEFYTYGDNFQNTNEAKKITQIRAEEYSCRKNVYHGESYAMGVASGHTFTLSNHYRDDCNAKFLVIKARHYGHNARYLRDGLSVQGQQDQDLTVYHNSFTAIRANVQFRSARKTPMPHYTGLLTAVVDAPEDWEYAELDDMGRYKVRMPFDLADHPESKASCWIRKAEFFTGNKEGEKAFGMHFPLHKGTEVLISFVEGDIDRPVIAAALYNKTNENPVTSKNNTYNILRTISGHRLVSNDQKNKPAFGFATADNSVMFVGHSDADNGGKLDVTTKKAVQASYSDSFEVKAGTSTGFTVGANFDAFAGSKMGITAGLTNEVKVGWSVGCCIYGRAIEFGEQRSMIHEAISQVADSQITMNAGSNAVVEAYYTSIKNWMAASAAAAVATNLGGWAAIAGAQGEYDDIDQTAAKIAGSIVGGLGAVTQVVGTAFAMYNYNKLSKEQNESYYTVRSVMGKKGVKHVVDSDPGNMADYSITVDGVPGNQARSSSIRLTARGDDIEIVNREDAKISLQEGKFIELEVTDKCIMGLTKTEAFCDVENAGAWEISDNEVSLRKNDGASVELTKSGVTIEGGVNPSEGVVKISAESLQMKTTTNINIKAGNLIMLA